MWLFGRRKPAYRAVHIWFWPTSATIVASWPGGLADRADHVVGGELAVPPRPRTVPRRLLRLGPPLSDLREIRRPRLGRHRLDLRQERLQNALHVADDRHLHGDVLADLGRIDVHVDDPGKRREGGHVAGNAVVETHAQGDQQIRGLDRLVRVLPAVHPDEAERERIGLVHGAHAQERVDHGDLGLLGEFLQFLGGIGDQDAVAGENDGPLGARDLLSRELDLAEVAVQVRLEARQIERVRVLGRAHAHQRVLGHVHVDGTRAAGAGDVEGLGDDARDVVGVADQVVVFGAGQRDTGDVDLLERVLARAARRRRCR